MLAVIFIASLLPVEHLPKGNDKIQHLASYAFLAWWFVLVFRPASYSQTFILALKLIAFGGMIELLQGLSGYRFAEWLDLLANSTGILIGCLIALKLSSNLLAFIDNWINTRF